MHISLQASDPVHRLKKIVNHAVENRNRADQKDLLRVTLDQIDRVSFAIEGELNEQDQIDFRQRLAADRYLTMSLICFCPCFKNRIVKRHFDYLVEKTESILDIKEKNKYIKGKSRYTKKKD